MSGDTHPGPFQSKAWEYAIVLREAQRIGFGFGGQRDGGWLCLLFAVGFSLAGVGVFLEEQGLSARNDTVARWVLGVGVFAAVLVLVVVGIHLLRGTNRVGVLDLKSGCFSAVHPWTGKEGQPLPCRQLHIHLEELELTEDIHNFYAKIAIVGPERPDREGARPQIDKTILYCLHREDFFVAVRELEEAASWKGIIGDQRLIDMHRSRL